MTACTEARAKELTARIRHSLNACWELVVEAYQLRVWTVLGYDNWADYVTSEFGMSQLKIPLDMVGEVVGNMREQGMSHRAIGEALGVGEATARRAAASFGAPSRQSVTGRDGKVYPARRPAAAVAAETPDPLEEDEGYHVQLGPPSCPPAQLRDEKIAEMHQWQQQGLAIAGSGLTYDERGVMLLKLEKIKDALT